jgi:ferredoxin--NADP+ reductase
MSPPEPVPGLPILPEVKMNLHAVTSPGTGVVVSSSKCTASAKAAGFVRHVAIDVSGTQLASNFRSGQSFGVIPPGVDAKGLSHKLRLYSIASPSIGEDASKPGRILATTVKRLIDERNDGGPDDHQLFLGVASNWLCDLKPGDTVPVTGPSGKRFILPADTTKHDYLFFATGTGIAPFRGMVHDLFAAQASNAAGTQSQIRLVMGSPYSTDLLYHEEFRSLERGHANFRYLPTLSREKNEDQAATSGKLYVQDRVGKPNAHRDDLLRLLCSERMLIYICGIAGMELGIVQALAAGLPPEFLPHYLKADAEAMKDIGGWTRRMLHKQVHVTKRVFLEVY